MLPSCISDTVRGMKSTPECMACLFDQAIRTAQLITPETKIHEKIIRTLAARVAGMSLEDNPAVLSQHVYDVAAEVSGVIDPYKQLKKETNQKAMELLPRLEELVFQSDDPLKNAVHLAVAGNVIDFGINADMDVEKDVLAIAEQSFAIDHLEEFRKQLSPGVKLLYLGDNSGEIVFDRVLLEELLELEADVVFAVKSGPIINDVTMEDAEFTGITGITRVIETGSNDIGVNWEKSSEEFKKIFLEADIILGKGHGNFETLSGSPYNVFSLLKAKCVCVARELGVPLGSIVFRENLL